MASGLGLFTTNPNTIWEAVEAAERRYLGEEEHHHRLGEEEHRHHLGEEHRHHLGEEEHRRHLGEEEHRLGQEAQALGRSCRFALFDGKRQFAGGEDLQNCWREIRVPGPP